MRIRRYEDGDIDELLRMVGALFPGLSAEDDDTRSTVTHSDAAYFVLQRDSGKLGGYVQVGERSVVDGCETSPVGYIEAWYVDADLRRTGNGRALLEAAENWARERGLREMGSDALLPNEVSHSAHRSGGYEEVDRVVNYRKDIAPPLLPNYVRQAVPFLWVADMKASLRFYVDGLGFTVSRQWLVDDRPQWCWLELGGAAVMLQELRGDKMVDRQPGSHATTIYFICTDAVAVFRGVTARGIHVRRPFVGNSMWVAELEDPDGHRLAFESPTDAAEESALAAG
jgi:GNAT superfamily N-acetyltransferase